MFDSLYVRCICGKEVEFQSKSGPCVGAGFTLNDCPPQVAIDLIGKSEQCADCGHVNKIIGQVMLMAV